MVKKILFLFLIVFASTLCAQNVSITGTVTKVFVLKLLLQQPYFT